MPQITNITGAAWPASGAASAGTTGFNVATGLTHVASTNVPPGSVATGYLAGVADAAVTFRLDATTVPVQATGDHYWKRFWFLPKRTATALAADGTETIFKNFTGGSFRFRVRSNIAGRITLNFWNLGPGTAETVQGVATTNLDHLLRFDEWEELCVHVYRHATAGYVEWFVGGKLASRNHTWDTDALATTWQSMQFTFGAIAGVQWILGPASSWSGTDISMRPIAALTGANDDWSRWFTTHLHDRIGGDFATTTAGGATVASALYYGSGGFNPACTRFSFGGTEAGTATAQTVDAVGTLPYDASGWATLLFRQAMVPAGALALAARNEADDADRIRLTVTGGKLKQGTTDIATIATNNRYAYGLHLNIDGRAAVTVMNLSGTFSASGTPYASYPLANWTPGAIGPVVYAATIGASAIEVEGFQVCRRWTAPGPDSYAHADHSNITPTMAGPQHIASAFCPAGTGLVATSQIDSLPGSASTFYQAGLERIVTGLPLGRSGCKISEFVTNALPGLTHTHNLRLMLWPSVNDLGTPATVLTAAEQTAMVAAISANLETIIEQLVETGNTIWLCTGMRPEVGGVLGTYSDTKLQVINRVNAEVRRLAKKHQAGGRVQLSDPAAYVGVHGVLYTASDGVHMVSTGDVTAAAAIVASRTTPLTDAATAIADGTLNIGRQGRRLHRS